MEIIQPQDEKHWLELRTKDITSTEIGALFGIDSASYIPTEFELWHRKKNNFAVDFDPNERVLWGTRLQDAIADGVAEDNGWHVRKMTEYIRDPELRIGASFDFSIESPVIADIPELEPGQTAMLKPEDVGRGLLEIKNVDSLVHRQKWIVNDDDTMEAPLHIELQVQHQLLVSRRAFAYIAALVGGNKVILIKREPDLAVHAAIKEKVKAFWKSIDDDIAPTPDFKRDADFISKLYGYAEVGKVIDASNDTDIEGAVRQYREVSNSIKDLEETKEGIKAQILMMIGDAEKATGNGWSVSAGMIAGGPVSYIRKPYRNFRTNFKKEFV